MPQPPINARRQKLFYAIWIIGILLFLVFTPGMILALLGLMKSIRNFSSLTFDHQLMLAGAYVAVEAVAIAVCILAAKLLFHTPLRPAVTALGLDGNFKTGWIVGFVASLPLLIILGVAGHATLNTSTLLFGVLTFSIVPGIAEEILFRGFAFGLLYRQVRLGFWLSVILPTAIFAIGHLYQASGIWEALGILAITGAGSVWFAWLYVSWDYNLWVPIAMHAFMNAWAAIFVISTGSSSAALGGTTSDIARMLTVVLSAVLTLWHCDWDVRRAFTVRPLEPAQSGTDRS